MRTGWSKLDMILACHDEIHLAIGMKVMVIGNVEMDLNIANGARGEVVDIVPHPDEPPIGDSAVVQLRYLPQYVLVKLARTRANLTFGGSGGEHHSYRAYN